jgi:hypothetical protein
MSSRSKKIPDPVGIEAIPVPVPVFCSATKKMPVPVYFTAQFKLHKWVGSGSGGNYRIRSRQKDRILPKPDSKIGISTILTKMLQTSTGTPEMSCKMLIKMFQRK